MTNFYCIMCINYIEANKCKAFNEIPIEIIEGKVDHSEPLSNQDNDIVFESIEND